MDLYEVRNSKAFDFKPIEYCWVISEWPNTCAVVFDLELLCCDMDLSYRKVLQLMDTFKMYDGKFWFSKIENPRLKEVQEKKIPPLKKYTIDLGVTKLMNEHFEQKN